MLYYLFKYIEENYDFPGAGLFNYITFRTSISVLLSLFIVIYFGKYFIRYLKKNQLLENVRKLDLEGEDQKKNTPTMGGLMIIAGILTSTLLFTDIFNIYIILLLVSTVWLGLIGYIDDYIKVYKKDKRGLKARVKILGQVFLGLIVGLTMYFHPDITIREEVESVGQAGTHSVQTEHVLQKSLKTNVPFFKNNELDYGKLFCYEKDSIPYLNILFFVFVCIFIITAVSNGSNLTDGLDGLCSGTSSIIIVTLSVFAFVSGNYIVSNYLDVLFIPGSGEIEVFSGALFGACIGFLWYNAYPAKIFMGDTGSLTIGGLIAVMAVMLRKELLIPLFCGIFLIENLSVILQVYYFKYTRIKTGIGKRFFLMTPIHHHFQRKGMHENKIVIRFWIVGLLLAVLSILTLKIR